MDPRIADFIRDNRRRYTREAIRQQLIQAGHDPAAIDATWAALDAPTRTPLPARGSGAASGSSCSGSTRRSSCSSSSRRAW